MIEGWLFKTLSEVYDVRDGTHDSPKYLEKGYPLVTSKNLKEGVVTYDKVKFISEEDYEKINRRSKVDVGDVLFAMIGTIGNPTVIMEKPNFAIKNVALFKVGTNQSSKFLKYYLESPFVINKLKTDAKGTTQKFVGLGYLRKFPIPIPPLQEQKQIAEILDQAFEAIDKVKANLEKNIANAKELFQAKLNEIFSQKGEGWEEKTLPQIAKEFGRGKSKHRPRNDKSLFGGDYPFIQTGDIRNCTKYILEYGSSYNEKGLGQSKLWPKGTICITIAANIAETAILKFDACFPDSVIGLIVNPKIADVNYTFYTLEYLKMELKAKSKGSAQANINMGTFKNQYYPFPPLHKQKEIVKELDKVIEHNSNFISNSLKKINNLEELKKSILQKAFAGELTQKEEVVKLNNTLFDGYLMK